MIFLFKAIRLLNPILIHISVLLVLFCGFQFNSLKVDPETDILKQIKFDGNNELHFSKVNIKFSLPTFIVPAVDFPSQQLIIKFFKLITSNYVMVYFENFYYTFTSIHAP